MLSSGLKFKNLKNWTHTAPVKSDHITFQGLLTQANHSSTRLLPIVSKFYIYIHAFQIIASSVNYIHTYIDACMHTYIWIRRKKVLVLRICYPPIEWIWKSSEPQFSHLLNGENEFLLLTGQAYFKAQMKYCGSWELIILEKIGSVTFGRGNFLGCVYYLSRNQNHSGYWFTVKSVVSLIPSVEACQIAQWRAESPLLPLPV